MFYFIFFLQQVTNSHRTKYKNLKAWEKKNHCHYSLLDQLSHGNCACMLTQSRPTLCDPADCSQQAPPLSAESRQDTGGGCPFLLQGIFLTHGLNPCLFHWQVDSLLLSHLGSPKGNCLLHKLFCQTLLLIELNYNQSRISKEYNVRLRDYIVLSLPSYTSMSVGTMIK